MFKLTEDGEMFLYRDAQTLLREEALAAQSAENTPDADNDAAIGEHQESPAIQASATMFTEVDSEDQQNQGTSLCAYMRQASKRSLLYFFFLSVFIAVLMVKVPGKL